MFSDVYTNLGRYDWIGARKVNKEVDGRLYGSVLATKNLGCDRFASRPSSTTS